MPWLVPSIIATMTGTAILAFCFLYLYFQDTKNNYMKIWGISWILYFSRYIFMLGLITKGENPYLLIGNQSTTLISGLMLLYGSYLFIEKKFPAVFLYFAAVNLVWIAVSILKQFSFMLMALPTFSFLAFVYIWTGCVFYRYSKAEQKEAAIVGLVFVLWGIHKANYPFLRPVAWFAPWGYLLGAALTLIAAVGLLLVYFRKTRNELINNQIRLLNAQKTANIGDWTWDCKTETLIWSDQTHRIFGHNPQTHIPSAASLRKTIHPDDLNTFINAQKKALKDKEDGAVEYRIILPDDRIRYVYSIFTVLKDSSGDPIEISGTIQDITDVKQAEERVISREQWYRSILNAAPMLIMIHQNGIIRYINKFGCTLLGATTHKELIHKPVFDLIVPEYHDRIKERMINLSEGMANPPMDIQILTKSGEKVFIHFSSVPFSFQEAPAVLVMAIDITGRKEFELEIDKQKRLFETMFNTIPDGVVITNTNREIRMANKGMESTFGYNPEDLTGKKTQMLYASEQNYSETGSHVFAEQARENGDLYITRYQDKYGREFSGETFGAKLFDEHNNWVGNLGIMRDITEREQAEIRIQQAQKMESIGTLAGGIAHDFNNILFPIIGMAELLLEDCPKDSMEYENAMEIYKAGTRGGKLVKQILAFSRQTENKLIPVRVQSILKEVLNLSRASIPSNITINRNIQQDCGMVLADPTQIHQIVLNLITNAYHAVEHKNGNIVVQLREASLDSETIPERLKHASRVLILSVSDNGTGIPPEIISKIFEPYFTTKKQDKGTGLGLSVVYGIVQSYNGDIRVASEVGKGTTFNIYLPLMDKHSESTEHLNPVDIQGGTERILLVDDEKPIIMVEEIILRRLGYTVTSYTSSSEALRQFKKSHDKFDLVITDMSMPEITGDQLAKKLKAIRPDIPVIICTGFNNRIDKEIAKKIGINGFLKKPIVKSNMAATIRTVLDRCSKQPERN